MTNEKMSNGKWKLVFVPASSLIVQFRESVPTHVMHERLSRNPLPCYKNCARHRLLRARARSTGNRFARDLKPHRSSFLRAHPPVPVVTQQTFLCCKESAG